MYIQVEGNNRKKRKAKLEIRYTEAQIVWHHTKVVKEKIHEFVSITVVEVQEKRHNGYKDEIPFVWRLLTTKNIDSLEQAKEVINIYKLRWKIEEYFKLLNRIVMMWKIQN